MSKVEIPYQGVNLQKTDTSMIKRLIDFSLDYDIQKPEEDLDSPKIYSTMLENPPKDIWEDDMVTVVEPSTPFNFKSLKNDEQIITNKIAYEWKNILRQVTSDSKGGETIDIKTFDAACLKF